MPLWVGSPVIRRLSQAMGLSLICKATNLISTAPPPRTENRKHHRCTIPCNTVVRHMPNVGLAQDKRHKKQHYLFRLQPENQWFVENGVLSNSCCRVERQLTRSSTFLYGRPSGRSTLSTQASHGFKREIALEQRLKSGLSEKLRTGSPAAFAGPVRKAVGGFVKRGTGPFSLWTLAQAP
jgi:hypothetical protein